MKNLKKVLALVLAFACAFTMFAGAAFTDAADITQTEAVDMLSALGVIDGYEDGSFQPDATITRAEAAKMIYTIWNGGDDNASAFVGNSVFTDVYSGYWAEGYINFCYTNGIVAGKSTTSFAPEEKVTGTELAKMLLICMGYQADKSGLEGVAWERNTNALATQNGLYAEVTAAISAAMPRQYAAQIMYNALKADTVKWSSDSNAYEKVTTTSTTLVQNADGSWSLVAGTTYETMGKKCMGLSTIENVQVRGVEKENGRDTYSVSTNLSKNFTRVAADYTDLIGQFVNVMIKDGDYSKVYGMYADEDCSVLATGVVGQLDTKDADTFKLAGTEYDTDENVADTPVYTINNDTSFNGVTKLNSIIGDAASAKNDAFSIKLIDTDNDGKVNNVTVTPVYVAKVTYANSDGIRVDNSNVASTVDTSYDFDDHNIADGIERDDWVIIEDADYTVDGKAVITKADVVSGTVGAVHTKSNLTTEVRVDGVWYKTADLVSNADRNTSIGNKVDLVVYGNMYFSVDGSAGSLDVAVVTGVGNYDRLNDVTEVRLMFQDGSEEIVDVERVITAAGSDGDWFTDDDTAGDAEDIKDDLTEGTMVAYDIDDDKYSVVEVANSSKVVDTDYNGVQVTSGTYKYDDDKATVTANGKTYDVDDAAMIVIKNKDNDYIYMTGAQLLDRNGITFDTTDVGYIVADDDGIIVAMYAKTDYSISSGAEQYGYIVDSAVEYIDDERKLVIDVITADGLIEDQVTDKDAQGDYTTGQVITYTMDGDVMVISEKNDLYYGAIQSNSDSRVRFYAGDRYTITEDTVVIALSDVGTTDATFEGNSLTNAQDEDHINAIYAEDDGEITVIFVDVDSDADASGKLFDFGKSDATTLTKADAKTQYTK